MEAQGIKETKEALLALVLLGKFVADRAKDGLAIDDAVALAQKLSDPAFVDVLKAAVEGVDKVAAEVKDLSFAEVLELAGVLPEILKILGK